MRNTPRSTNKLAALLLFISVTLLTRAAAFVAPSHRVRPRATTSAPALPEVATTSLATSLLLADGLSAATRLGVVGAGDAYASLAGPLASLRTFFVVLAAAAFGLTALAYLTAVVLVPRAAEQLERDTKRLRPGLWEDYEARLEAGENMAMRPDLLQELGNVMQPLIFRDIEAETARQFDGSAAAAGDGAETAGGSAPPTQGEGKVIEVTKRSDEQ